MSYYIAKIKYAVLITISAAILLSISYFRVFDEFEFSTLDFRFKFRADQPVNKDIVIIHIGDDTIDKLGQWPIPRKYHGIIVDALHAAGAKEIIFDVFFSEAAKGDGVFKDAIKKTDNTYLPYIFEVDLKSEKNSCLSATRVIAPLIEPLRDVCKNTGFINIQPDMDGKVRSVYAFMKYGNNIYPQMTVLAALNSIGIPFEEVQIIPGKRIVLDKKREIPLGEHSEILVNYPAKWGEAFRHYSYVDILQSYMLGLLGKEPVVDLEELKDKVCFIGFTAAASPDAHPSPLEPLYPGVGVHASIYNSIVREDFLYRVNRWGNLLILIIMWLLTAFITAKSRKSFAFVSIGLIIAAYATVAIALFCFMGIWIDVFYPIVTIVGVYIFSTFKKYLIETRTREIMEKELDIAKDIQQSFLPKEIPHVGGLDIAANMVTARQVGGDLYDFIELENGRFGVMMGDVSGKGVPAALFMAKASSVFKTLARQGSVSEVVKNMNEKLTSENSSNLFVTLTYMIFDTKAGRVSFASGGHNPTLYISSDGEAEWLKVEDGMPLGLIEGVYSEDSREYKSGSVFVLYTDGVTEAMNLKEEMFEEEKLLEVVKGMVKSTSQEIAEEIQKKVSEFAGRAKQHDDITVLVVKA